jgi:parallel beta-helix repeat protein
VTVVPENVRAAQLYVGGTGPGNYTTIQAAVDAAIPGDSIFVHNGTYSESVWVDRTVSLIGEDRETTIIHPTDSYGVSLQADWTNFTGFTIAYDGISRMGTGLGLSSSNYVADNNISIYGQFAMLLGSHTGNSIIQNNIVSSNHSMGIYSPSASHNNVIVNNTIVNNSNGIELRDSKNNTIIGNTLMDNEFGIRLDTSPNTLIESNLVVDNDEDGIRVFRSTDTRILRNSVFSNKRNGIVMYYHSDRSVILENNFSGNIGTGIWVMDSIDNVVSDNTFFSNGGGIGLSDSSNDNIISNNTLLKNGGGVGVQGDSSRNVIADNTILSGGGGIGIRNTDNNVITNNTVSFNEQAGIYFYFSSYNQVTNNVMEEDGIYIEGWSLDNWNTHLIDTSNTVNGKPVHYWKNSTGGTVPPGAGEVILANCSNVVISNQNVSNGTVGIELGFSSHNSVEDNTIISNNIEGIHLYRSENNTISNNTASLNKWRGIMLYESDNNTISNDTISESHRGIYFYFSSRNDLLGSNVTLSTYRGIDMLSGVENTLALNNVSSNPGARGIVMSGADNNVLVNNVFSSNDVGGLLATRSDGNTIANSSFYSNGGFGVILFESKDNVVNNLTVSDNENGIQVDTLSEWNTIANSFVSSNSGDGISVQDSTNISVRDNMVVSNGRNGINLTHTLPWEVLTDNRIVRNTFSANGMNGIRLNLSDNSTIAGNNITNNAFGLSLESSDLNHIYHNEIINNTIQASDDTDTNQWDNGYPSGGNYWSDYAGFDVFSGPNQNERGRDGIGDTPYVIDPDSEDRYPLMAPPPIGHLRSPVVLQAVLTGNDMENVSISWSLSLDDGGGANSVVEYQIYRNTSYDHTGLSYVLVGSVPSGTSGFVDTFAGEGNPADYFYQICARDLNNFTRCSEIQAAKFTRHLKEGPNLVSIPLIQSSESAVTVLQTLNWNNTWKYNSSTQKWIWHMKSKPFAGELRNFNHREGLWANVVVESNLTVAGLVPSITAIQLRAGWNLVGFPSVNTTYTAGELKAVTGATRVEGYDANSPPYFLREMQDLDILLGGQGYWIFVPADVIWTVPYS